MRLSYRARLFYRGLIRAVFVLILVVVLLLLCWVLWLRRFIIYTADGVKLDFSMSQQFPQGQVGQDSMTLPQPDIFFSQPETTQPPPVVEQKDFAGYYVTLDELLNQRDAVLEAILALPAETPVLLDVKGYWGYSYYTSTLSSSSGSFIAAEMDAFFAAVNASGAYAIARLPAFRNYDFAEKNTACGLKESRGYLWVDKQNCYWLDPSSEMVLNFLVEMCRELKNMGFDEVAFTDFAFPDTDAVVFNGDRQAAIENAAAVLTGACAREDFVVSFITTDPTFHLPAGNCRLYLQDVAAADVQTVLMLLEPGVMERTVFFTNSGDTRYDVCGVIRPLYMAE